MKIILPLPDAKLHAHNKGKWQSKSKAVRTLRELARMMAIDPEHGEPWEFAGITYRFYFKDRRRRDAANCVQSMKPAVDGVVDAGVIAGDDWQRLQIDGVFCAVDKDNPRTVLEFRKITDVTDG